MRRQAPRARLRWARLAATVGLAVPLLCAVPPQAMAAILPGSGPTPAVPPIVLPKVTLSAPPIAVRSSNRVGMTIVVDERSVTDTDAVSLVLSRLESGRWRVRQRVRCTIASVTRDRTVLTASFRTISTGRWSACAQLVWLDASHPARSNSRRFVVVGSRWVALTFDDGPWPGSTAGVLKVLRSRDVKATFFVLGSRVRASPGDTRRAAAAGHQVGNHTMSHVMLAGCSASRIRSELTRTNRYIRAATGRSPTVFRPPGGSTSTRVAHIASDLGMRQVLWTVDPWDWSGISASSIRSRVLHATRPGGIVLLHDGGGDRSNTVRALPGIIDTLRARGYGFVTMDEWGVLKSSR